MLRMKSSLVVVLALVFAPCLLRATDPPNTNYDEAMVGTYTLPDPLVCADGTKVTDARTWIEKRRPELLELFRANMHGRSPARPAGMTFEIISSNANALGGKATRREVAIRLGGEKDAPVIHLLLYIPNAAKKPVPTFLGVNFDGNQTVAADPGIKIIGQWTWDKAAAREVFIQPAEETRGKGAGQWAVGKILARGYALATIPRADIEPDYAEGWRHGVRGWFLKEAGRSEFAPDDWGAVAAWAWGLSRALDYLATDPDIDAKRVAVMGHSRMGKAAVWAGADDERFAIVISNESGEGGAALARRWFGETTAVINEKFPYWFCGNFKQFSNNDDRLPFDEHELLALVAPRPLYVASAQEDRWSDPRGEFLSAKAAEPVWRLFGKAGLGVDEMPPVNHPVGDTVAYHIRPGRHDVTDYDWEQYLAFADRFFKK
jgi:hypothetical protein